MLYESAGTGMSRYQHFYRQVEVFHRDWRQFFQARMFARARLSAEDFARMPAFTYTEESGAAVFGRIWAPLAGVSALAVGLLSATLVSYRRYQPV